MQTNLYKFVFLSRLIKGPKMIDREYFRKLISTGAIFVLIVLSFFLLKPILLSIFIALILGYLFHPVYKKVKKILRSGDLSAFLMCLFLAALFFLPIWFLTPVLLKQSLGLFLKTQQLDLITPLSKAFPDLFASESFSREVGSALSSFIVKASGAMTNLIADLIRDFPILFLQFLVVFFTFFFALRDQEKFLDYIRSIMPFSKDIEDRLFQSSRGITVSVIYGQIFLGIIQGLLVGVGLFLFNVNNALLFTLLAMLAGIFPIIGTTVVWIPITIYLFAIGDFLPAIGVAIFGILSSIVENLIKPIIIAKKAKMHSALVLIGMVGGVLLFGVMGIILGPLILAYLLIFLEIYRDKKVPGLFTPPSEDKS